MRKRGRRLGPAHSAKKSEGWGEGVQIAAPEPGGMCHGRGIGCTWDISPRSSRGFLASGWEGAIATDGVAVGPAYKGISDGGRAEGNAAISRDFPHAARAAG